MKPGATRLGKSGDKWGLTGLHGREIVVFLGRVFR
jgi:hypothetical protein